MPFITHVESKALLRFLRKLPNEINKEVKEAVRDSSRQLTTYVKEKYLSGRGKGVRSRSGELRDSTKPARTTVTKDGIKGGVRIGASAKAEKYRNIHIGPPSKKTVIRSNRPGGYLAIPVGPALKGDGTPKYKSPRDVAGLTISGKKGSQTILARKDGETYFIYKKRITVQARINPDEISRKYAPIVARNINKAVKDAI